MLENYLVFSISNKEFAASLVNVPIVLIAKKYIESTHLNDINEIRLPFEGAAIQLIDIAGVLSLKPSKLTFNSRLLVGQLEENFFGFIVDDVKEIIMIDENDDVFIDSTQSDSILYEMNIDGRDLKIISIENVLNSLFQNGSQNGDRK